MAIYLFSEGKFDQIFLPEILNQLNQDYCSLTNNDTKSLLNTDRNYYQEHQFILFSDNGRSDIYTKIMRRFCVSFLKKESAHPVHVILFLDDDYSTHDELNRTLLDHIREFSYLIPPIEPKLNTSENVITLKLPSDTFPRITIKVFYIPHSLERQIVLGGLPHLGNQKLTEVITEKGPHQGLRELSLDLSCSVEETIKKSVQDDWLIDHQWYQDLLQLLKNPPFS
jgi:hypothetical protein